MAWHGKVGLSDSEPGVIPCVVGQASFQAGSARRFQGNHVSWNNVLALNGRMHVP